MPLTGLLKIDGIEGESNVANHDDEIDVFDVMWEITRPNSAARGAGRARGRAIAGDFRFRKLTDASSPYLALACSRGQTFDEITFTASRVDGTAPFDYFVITLSECIVSGFHIDGVEDLTQDQIKETVSIAAQSIKILYTIPSRGAGANEEHEVEFDLSASSQSVRPAVAVPGFVRG